MNTHLLKKVFDEMCFLLCLKRKFKNNGYSSQQRFTNFEHEMTKLLYRIILVKSFYDFSFLSKMINYYLFFASGVDELHRSHEKIEAKIGKRNLVINIKGFFFHLLCLKKGMKMGQRINCYE